MEGRKKGHPVREEPSTNQITYENIFITQNYFLESVSNFFIVFY